MENWFIPYQATLLKPVKRVLILAPHPDDEVFGCGGAAFLHRQQGAEVTVVVVSDGAAHATESERGRMFSIRQAETDHALDVLGIPPAIFWGLPDREVGASTLLPLQMADLLRAQSFDRIYTPSLSEIHPDHLACTRAALAALAQLHQQGQPLPEVVLYEVGMPLMPNCLVDISGAWAYKKQAMQCFASQQAQQNYARHVEGLNTYRTYTLGHEVTHAEAYNVLSADELSDFCCGTAPLSPSRWPDSVLRAAQASAEALQAQVVVQTRLISDLQSNWRLERQELGAQLAESALQTGKLQWQVAHQTTEFTELQSQLKRQHTDLSEKITRLNELEWQVTHQAQEVKTLTEQIAEQQKAIADQVSAHNTLLMAHQTMLSSKSWRITRPLRWLMRQLKPTL